MQCLILAGGLGTRMQHLGGDVPKALIPVNGRPFADYQLQWLADQGVRRVVYAIGYKGDLIRQFVGNGERWGLQIRYADEGEKLLGTAGAIRRAIAAGLMDDGFFVLYGDSYLCVDLPAVWEASDNGGFPLMTIFRNDGQWDGSNVIAEDGKIILFEKNRDDARDIGMGYIDYGLSVLTAHVITANVAESEAADLADVFHRLSLSGELRAFEAQRRFYEIGSPQGLVDLEARLATGNSDHG